MRTSTDTVAALRARLERAEREAAAHQRQLERYAADLRESYRRERARAQQLRRSYKATVRALSNAVEARDAYTGKHAERVAAYGLAIARAAGIDVADEPQMEFGFLLHDIGKVGVPDAILFKPAALSADEFTLRRPPRRDRLRDPAPRRLPRRGDADRPPPPRALGRHAATRTASRASRSRSRRACSRSPTRSTR